MMERLRAPDHGSTAGGLLSGSPPEEHHERRTFCRRGGNSRPCDSSSAIFPKEVFADSFQKIHERCQQCVVKDVDYFEGQKSLFVCIFCLVCFLVPFTELFRHTT
jgi:hypothetical protein